jgi:hypothetical protein
VASSVGKKQAATQDEFAQLYRRYQTAEAEMKVWRAVLRKLKTALTASQFAMIGESALLKLADSKAEVCVGSPLPFSG